MSTISTELELLVNWKLDGTISEEELDALHRLVSESDEARRYLRDMEQLDASLRNFARDRADPDLSREVMDRIKHDQEHVFVTGRKSQPLRFRFQGQQLLRYAAILIFGLLLGSAVTLMVQPGRLFHDTADMTGTMAARSGQKLAFSQDDWQVQINPMIVDQMVILVFSAASDQPLDVSLSFDSQTYRLIRARYLNGTDRGSTMQAGAVRFGINGKAVYQVVLNQNSGISAPLFLEVIQDGAVRYSSEIFL